MLDPVALRHALHSSPELSGAEARTAARLRGFFEERRPDRSWTELGGHGLAFRFDGATPGPTTLLRADMDALPIPEEGDLPHASCEPGVSHKCGHDGHMAILAAVGDRLAQRRPRRGRVILLFQPAEETGAGAAAVLADPRYAELAPDRVFALHNLPGVSLGEVVVRRGTFCCASRGQVVTFQGRAAHAAQPWTGASPARAMADLVGFLDRLRSSDPDEPGFATVVGARLREKGFGTAPDHARVMTTLRTVTDSSMAAFVETSEARAEGLAARDDLRFEVTYRDVFPATVNAAAAVERLRRAASPLRVSEANEPLPWSEDFGRFTARHEGALFGLGSGEDQPALHDPAYDFPDDLVEIGAELFLRLVDLPD